MNQTPSSTKYTNDQNIFFKDFAAAMEKLSLYGVKTGSNREVRRRCDGFNNLKV